MTARADHFRTLGAPPTDAAILAEHAEGEACVLREHDRQQERARELVSFTGPASFGLITQVAAELEAAGKVVYAHWRRDARGIITGISIMEHLP